MFSMRLLILTNKPDTSWEETYTLEFFWQTDMLGQPSQMNGVTHNLLFSSIKKTGLECDYNICTCLSPGKALCDSCDHSLAVTQIIKRVIHIIILCEARLNILQGCKGCLVSDWPSHVCGCTLWLWRIPTILTVPSLHLLLFSGKPFRYHIRQHASAVYVC